MALKSSKTSLRIVVDAHQKIALQALLRGADYLRHPLAPQSLLPQEKFLNFPLKVSGTHIGAGLPDALLGRVAVVFAAIVTAMHYGTGSPLTVMEYNTLREAYEAALKQWDYYQHLVDTTSQAWLLKDAADLELVLDTWQEGTPLNARKQGLLLTLSGADAIYEPRQFEEWYERGVRCVGLIYRNKTQYCNDYNDSGYGLTRKGRELLEVLADYHVIVDLMNISRKAFYEVVDRYEGPLLVSHAKLEDKNWFHSADLSRHAVCSLAERNGVVGLRISESEHNSAYGGNYRPSLRLWAQWADTICQWTGSNAHVAFGSNLATPFYSCHTPEEIDTTGDLWKLRAELEAFGFSAEDVEAFMSGNLLRLLRQALR